MTDEVGLIDLDFALEGLPHLALLVEGDQLSELAEVERRTVAVDADQLGGGPRSGARDEQLNEFALLAGRELAVLQAHERILEIRGIA